MAETRNKCCRGEIIYVNNRMDADDTYLEYNNGDVGILFCQNIR